MYIFVSLPQAQLREQTRQSRQEAAALANQSIVLQVSGIRPAP